MDQSIVSTGVDSVTGMSAQRILSYELSHALMNQVLGPLSSPIYGLPTPVAMAANLLMSGQVTAQQTMGWLHALTPFEHWLQSYPGSDL